MIQISADTLTLIGFLVMALGAIFAVFFYFQKPQIALEKRVQTLEDDNVNLNKEIEVIKATHLENNGSMQKEMKELTLAVNDLGKTVVRLSTIIDERIPKGSPNLTPPGV